MLFCFHSLMLFELCKWVGNCDLRVSQLSTLSVFRTNVSNDVVFLEYSGREFSNFLAKNC
jgi:hypothetical protein